MNTNCHRLPRGGVFWLTGLSGAGKTSTTSTVGQTLESAGVAQMVLDGDTVRRGLNEDLGFSAADRRENLRRVAYVAKLFSEKGFICLCSFITPFEEERALVRSIVGDNFYLVHIDCPLQECIQRDSKGLYRKALSGEIENFTGISQPFEKPQQADLCINTRLLSREDAAQSLLNFIASSLHIPILR